MYLNTYKTHPIVLCKNWCEKYFKIACSEIFYVAVFQKLMFLIYLTKKTVCWHLQILSTAMSKYLSWLRVRLIRTWNLVAFKKRLGIPQLYEPHHKIIKAINIQGSLSCRMHALICYSPFFHHVHFDKKKILTWNKPKIKIIYKKYVLQPIKQEAWKRLLKSNCFK